MSQDILFIAIEDVSAQRFGCWGSPIGKTPCIDRLTSEGLRFELTNSMVPVCNPSRTSLMTCLRPVTTGVFGNGHDWRAMAPGKQTMAEYLVKQGYETIRIGKILHATYEHEPSWSRVISTSDGLPPVERPMIPGHGPGLDYAERKIEARKQGKDIPGGTPFVWGSTGREDEEEEDGRIAEQAIRILNQKQDKPLFLALGFHKPHLPFRAPGKYFDLYPPESMPLPDNPEDDLDDTPYDSIHRDQASLTPETWREAIAAHHACLSFTDAQVGKVLDALEESGRAKDTIVVLWSDHGFMLGEHFLWRKPHLFDICARVPMITRVPGVTSPGTVCPRPTEQIDIFPTLFDLCDIPIPDGVEGISMKSLLTNPEGAWKKGAISDLNAEQSSIRTERWRYNRHPDRGKCELYDHTTDPKEYTNLAGDPAYSDVVAELGELLEGGWKACLPEN